MAYYSILRASKKLILLITIVSSLMAIQLIACSEQAAATGNAATASAEFAPTGSDSKPWNSRPWNHPIVVVKSGLSSGELQNKALKKENNKKPDFWLIFLEPYEEFIPKQVMDMIDQNVRPQTENMSSQIISTFPGAEEAWAQISGIINSLQNMGGFQSILSGATGGDGNGLSGLMENFGRRKRR